MSRAIAVSTVGMSKHFGSFTALDNVSISVPAGQFHVLLGENGAGKSTLVKCIMGFYQPDAGSLLVDWKPTDVRNPRDARALGIGMVYQHFTLVPSLTGAENLVISRADTPAVIDWRKERKGLADFMDRMPFRVPLDVPVAALAAGEKQKLEILKLLYLDQRFLILDEPTSVLTPDEADEMLGLLRGMTSRGDLTVLMISHKFREVLAFADAVSVLRRGALVGGGMVADMTTDSMARHDDRRYGDPRTRFPHDAHRHPCTVLDLAGIFADDDAGKPAVDGVSLKVGSGRNRRHRRCVRQWASGPRRGAERPAPHARWPGLHQRQTLRAGAQGLRSLQGLWPARGTAEERRRAPHVGRREHRLSSFRQASCRAFRLVAVALTHPGQSRGPGRALQGQDRLARRPDRDAVGRQRATRHSGPRTVGRRRRAHRRQPVLRARLRLGGRDPLADHGPAQSWRRRAAWCPRISTRSSNWPTAWP